MGRIIKRGNRLSIRFKNVEGRWQTMAARCTVGEEKKAQALLDEVERRVASGQESVCSGNLVRDYAKVWLAEAEKRGVRDLKSEEGRLRLHVLPRLGARPLASIRPVDIKRLIFDLMDEGKLARKSIHNVYAVLRSLFNSAVFDELIDATPCVLTRQQLGDARYKDEMAQQESVYSREQLTFLISSPSVPRPIRVFCALGGLAGLRLGEMVALCWSDYNPERQPLGELVVARSHDRGTTKTGVTRRIPVHPTLAKILAAWRREGWCELMGRTPNDDELIVPRGSTARTPAGSRHSKSTLAKQMNRVLDTCEWPRPAKVVHALRSTFVSLSVEFEAQREVIQPLTHPGRTGRSIDRYTKTTWETACREVAKIGVELPGKEPSLALVEAPVSEPAALEERSPPHVSPGATPGSVTPSPSDPGPCTDLVTTSG